MDENIEISPQSFKQVQVWTDGETRMMLDLYGKYMPEIGPMKKFKNKKAMWSKISEAIPTKTRKQCEERYKTVLKRKKIAIENNNTSGAKHQRVDFEEELENICSLDDSLEPEVQLSSQKYVKKENKNKNYENGPKKTIHDTLFEIAKMKEEAKERRHKEKMEAVNTMHTILLRISEQNEIEYNFEAV
ncbi:uncharacterized protein LOC142225841 [Haematobia irritans]|uniref:uncharacterized protein LOC142225841 n=1 Tax=Haematobia irritans TaxID=7368 RepID=UPI003F4FF4E7